MSEVAICIILVQCLSMYEQDCFKWATKRSSWRAYQRHEASAVQIAAAIAALAVLDAPLLTAAPFDQALLDCW